MTEQAARTDTDAWSSSAAEVALAELAATTIDATDKGFADLDGLITPTELRGASVHESPFSTPLMVLRQTALLHNIDVMAAFCADRGAVLAPHAKTTMSPELFVRQLAAGAWGLTAANVTQARVFVAHGARRVVIANEVTAPSNLASLARLLRQVPDLHVLCYIDSVAGVQLLEQTFRDSPERAPEVLVELGIPGGRTGVRTPEDALDVARFAHTTSAVRVVGVSAFEGPLTDRPDTVEAVHELYAEVRRTGEVLATEGLLRPREGEPALIVSGGGSHDFDIVADELGQSAIANTLVVVRSGSYVTHDNLSYLLDSPSRRGADIEPFVPAIEVHGTVLSRPETDQAFIDVGRRDVSFDSGLPIVLGVVHEGAPLDVTGFEVTALNDQHGFLSVPPECALGVGDRVVLGISHPCTTFDKWQHAAVVDDDDRVVEIAHTFF